MAESPRLVPRGKLGEEGGPHDPAIGDTSPLSENIWAEVPPADRCGRAKIRGHPNPLRGDCEVSSPNELGDIRADVCFDPAFRSDLSGYLL